MDKLISLSVLFLFSISLNAQLSDGTIAPAFTLDDWQFGDTHVLYDYLDDGKSVILDFGATWCVPCWNYHQSGTLEALYDDFGPDGTDQIMVFMIEADGDTSQNCIEDDPGCIGGTVGDWTDVNYPILNPPANEADNIANDYGITFWPTLYGVAPNGEVYLIGQAGYSEWESYTVGSFQLVNSSYEIIESGCSYDVDLLPVGGYGDLEYEWSNGAFTEDLIDVSGEELYVTITDENDFEAIIGPIDVPEGDGHELELIETTDLLCYNDFTGSITVEATGGSGSFTYDWSNGDTGETIWDLEGGEISVWVTDNNNGCTSESFFFINEPEALEVDITTEDAGCEETGSVYLDAFGGTGAYEYQFDGFSTFFNEIELEPGNYDVTITDWNDCELYENFTIASTDPPVANSSVSGEINCSNSTVTLMSTGSTTGNDIEYYWFDSNGNVIGTDPSIVVANGGMYSLEVFDGESGCSSMDMTTVNMNNTIPTATSSYSNVIDCTNTTSTLNGAGSSSGPTITYNWTTTDGAILSDPTLLSIEVGSGGSYTLSISDSSNGCSSSSIVTVPSNGNIPSANLSGGSDFCEGESTQICVENPNGYSVTWVIDGFPFNDNNNCIIISTGATVEATVTDLISGCSSSAVLTTSMYSLPNSSISGSNEFCAGGSTSLCVDVQADEDVTWYADGTLISVDECVTISETEFVEAVVTNANGCTSSSTISTNSLAAPNPSVTGNNVICDNSTTTLCTDDMPNHSYVWTHENGQVLGDMACIQTNLGGEITVLVTNENSCMTSAATSIISEASPTININPPGILDCNNSEITLSATSTGGVISWFDSNGTALGQGDTYTTNLAGSYSCTSSSPNGCMTSASINVEQDNNALPTSNFVFQAQDYSVSFENQSLGEVTSYLWDFGDGNTSTEENPDYTYTVSGTYTVCLTVTNDCGSNSVCSMLTFSDVLSVLIEVQDVQCFGEASGVITININGGLSPYEISTSPDIGSSEVITDVPAGSYDITIQDANGEAVTYSVMVFEPTQIMIYGDVMEEVGGAGNGSISVTPEGGNEAAYSYSWSNGANAATIDNLTAGDYSVTVVDADGCWNSANFTVGSISSIHKIAIVEEFFVMPNPASDFINVELELNTMENINLQILNSMGVVVYNSKISKSLNLDVSNLETGLYFVHLSHENQSMSKKLLIVD